MLFITGARSVNWTRFRGTHELELKPTVYAVTARSQHDERESNWLGKSAWLAGVRWALDGRRVLDKDALDELITDGEDEAAFELELSDGTFISRVKKRGKSAQLLVVLSDGRKLTQGGAQAALDELIGIGADDRLTTCFAEQRELASLVRMTSSQTTQMFERWVELEGLVEAGKMATDWLGSKSSELARAQAELAADEDEGAAEKLAVLEASIAQELARCIAQDDAYALSKVEAERYYPRRALADLIAEEKSIEDEIKGLGPEPPRSVADMAKLERQVTKAAGVAQEKASRHRQAVSIATAPFDGKCPVSPGFECPAAKQITARTEPNRKAAEEAGKERQAAEKAAGELGDKLLEARATERRRSDFDSKLAGLNKRLVAVRVRKAELSDVDPLDRLPDGTLPQQAPIGERADRTELQAMERELAARREAAARLPGRRSEVARLERELRAHRAAAAVLGPEGARRRAVERVVARVVAGANAGLSRAGIDLSVRAAWGRETGDPAERCAECGRAFPASARASTCERCGAARGRKVKHEFRFRLSNVSGAAEDLASLALRASAFEWLVARRSSPWSVSQLDEPLAQLDEARRAAVSASLQRLLAGTFKQAFVTAHDRGVLDAMPGRILITGYGRDSKIEVVA